MKRLLPALLAVLMLFSGVPVAMAVSETDAIQSAKAMLTEVYGYTAQATADFEYKVVDQDGVLFVTYYPKAHPNWVYSLMIDGAGGEVNFQEASTPFDTEYPYYPGQNAIMGMLNEAKAGGWFSHWDRAAMNAMQERLKFYQEIRINSILAQGLSLGTLSAARAVQALFESCYGDALLWPEAVEELRDEILAENGLALEIGLELPTDGESIYTVEAERQSFTVTQFVGKTPDMLADVFTHPKLTDWQLLCGAVVKAEWQGRTADTPLQYGLAAFEKGENRLLVMVIQEETGWRVIPVGERALLPDRELSIIYDVATHRFSLVYPISPTEREIFFVHLMGSSEKQGYLCDLYEYRHVNEATGEGIAVSKQPFDYSDTSEWFYATTRASGKTSVQEKFPCLMPNALDYLDAAAFPKTIDECRSATGYVVQENYGVTSGVHLREKTSSRSKDLGDYNRCTLVEIIETLPGNPDPWVHVRIGSVEGYMSSVYVEYPGSVSSMQPLKDFMPIPVGMTRQQTALKKGMGWFDGVVQELPAGTKFHVLATCGDWLHVMLPAEGEPGWLMDVNGTDGYVKAKDVVQAATALQLDWLK